MTLVDTVINKEKTKEKARKILEQYRRLNRIAGHSSVDLKAPVITDMPKATTRNAGPSDKYIAALDAQNERAEIINAIISLPTDSRMILAYSFCELNKKTNYEIADTLTMSLRTFDRNKDDALLQFAEAYKKGSLLVFDKRKMA